MYDETLTRSLHCCMPGVLRSASGLFARWMPPCQSACLTCAADKASISRAPHPKSSRIEIALETGQDGSAVTLYLHPPQKNACTHVGLPGCLSAWKACKLVVPCASCSSGAAQLGCLQRDGPWWLSPQTPLPAGVLRWYSYQCAIAAPAQRPASFSGGIAQLLSQSQAPLPSDTPPPAPAAALSSSAASSLGAGMGASLRCRLDSNRALTFRAKHAQARDLACKQLCWIQWRPQPPC